MKSASVFIAPKKSIPCWSVVTACFGKTAVVRAGYTLLTLRESHAATSTINQQRTCSHFLDGQTIFLLQTDWLRCMNYAQHYIFNFLLFLPCIPSSPLLPAVQNNTTGPFSRKTEEQHWLIHEAAGRILIRLWEITYALHTLLQEERWWAGRLRGHFVWLAIDLFLLISHLKTLGVFMYGENSLQQHLKAIQPARFGSKVKACCH